MRAGGVGRSLDGVEVRRVAAGSCLCSESPTLTAYLGWTSTRERGRPARTLFLQTACHPRPLPCKAHQTRLYGVLFPRAGVCAGETPALPGGLCAGGTPALPGGLSSRAVMPPSREWSEKQIDRLAGGRIRARWRSGRSLDGVEVRSVAAGSCLCSVGHRLPGVPPAPYSCKQPPMHGHSLAKRTFFHRVCGRDARAPGGSFFTSRNASIARMVRETNRPTRWRSNPCALEELAGHWMASKSEGLRRAPVCVRWGIPWERGLAQLALKHTCPAKHRRAKREALLTATEEELARPDRPKTKPGIV